ncbi:extracellular solute-binding protein [Paenibacillus sp. MBLB4367]|uniref:extracellular solute-binding protein n=1 Tax=Paenibacillus sp. MBLB4367 TaxID=3384767 RepID=UPI0039080B5C
MSIKRFTAVCMLPVVGAGLLAGCEMTGSPGGQTPAVKFPVAKDAGKRMTINIVANSQGSTFPAGTDENHNEYLDYIEQNTNLDVKVTLPPIDGYDDKLNVIMSSGELPDMLNAPNPSWFINYVNRNALMPLDDLIDRYGPELKERIPQEAWENVTVNGHIYAVPSLNEVKGAEIMYIRKDWLDRLGLKPPRTLEEYYEVMKAFKDRDPDGNGQNDTIGFAILERLGRTAPIFGAFGTQIMQSAWLERDGRLVSGATLPETKEALAFLSKLYAENLLDPQFPLNKSANFQEKIASGKVGLFSAAWSDTRGPIETNRKRDPKAVWIPLDFPVGANGSKGTYDMSIVRSYNVIPAASKNGEGVIRFLNFIGGKGHRDLKLGFENEIWTKEDGKMVTNFAEHTKHYYRGIYSALADTIEPDVSKDRLDSLGEQFNLWDNLQRIELNLIRTKFTGTPTQAMGKYNARLLKDQEDTFTKIVLGVAPLSEFDVFVERWYREGGDEITREVNEWYSRRQAK